MEIAIVLPIKEGFSDQKFGALSLCVQDNITHSRFKDMTTVYGVDSNKTFKGINFQNIDYKKDYNKLLESKTKAYCRQLAEVFNKTKPTLIEIHNRPIISHYLREMTGGQFPISLHIHNDPKHMLVADVPKSRSSTARKRKKMIENHEIIYCVSDYIKKELLDGIKAPSSHVHTLYNGLNIPKIDLHKKRKKQFIYVGRVTYEKGPLEFAEAALLVKDKLPDWQFVFVGRMRKKKRLLYEQETMNAIDELGKRATYHGLMPHRKIMDFFQTSEVAILPSFWREPFGRTVLEAMASGASVITSGNGGLAEVSGDTTLHIEDHNVKDLATKMMDLAENDTLRKNLQKTAYERAKKHFEIRIVSTQLDDFRTQYVPQLSKVIS
ncbi:MAG: glycosyltransferase family 4 protein [Alphaproteobacteria bacterium]